LYQKFRYAGFACMEWTNYLKKIKMKLFHHVQQQDTSNLFLYGAIMFANIDYVGIADYVIKAILGGGVWFGFKLLQDYFSVKVRLKARTDIKQKDEDDDNQPENQQHSNHQ
jgi:hypothetical protein